MAEKCVCQSATALFEGSMMVVRCAGAVADGFQLKVGLHQGLSLSPFFFSTVMHRLANKVQTGLCRQ